MNSLTADIMDLQRSLWQHSNMIDCRTLADDHSNLAHSRLLRGDLLTLQYAEKHGSIGLARQGTELAQAPGRLFAELISNFVL
ncbi:hypothetical protein [Pseudophaeobacter leonis]|uniref:hypothetical protein n=1 Tax=Pseudophaeobacter leonis TaxID=1144477 RepID=UPI0030C66952